MRHEHESLDHSQRKLVHEALTPCPVCRVLGPKVRLEEHLRLDHGRRA